MIRKRIGKTLLLRWKITTNGEDLSLDGRVLTLFLIDPSGNQREMDYQIKPTGSNTVEFKFQGKDQKIPGYYSLEMWENKGQDEQTVVDKINAFELVRNTKDEGDCKCRKY